MRNRQTEALIAPLFAIPTCMGGRFGRLNLHK